MTSFCETKSDCIDGSETEAFVDSISSRLMGRMFSSEVISVRVIGSMVVMAIRQSDTDILSTVKSFKAFGMTSGLTSLVITVFTLQICVCLLCIDCGNMSLTSSASLSAACVVETVTEWLTSTTTGSSTKETLRGSYPDRHSSLPTSIVTGKHRSEIHTFATFGSGLLKLGSVDSQLLTRVSSVIWLCSWTKHDFADSWAGDVLFSSTPSEDDITCSCVTARWDCRDTLARLTVDSGSCWWSEVLSCIQVSLTVGTDVSAMINSACLASGLVTDDNPAVDSWTMTSSTQGKFCPDAPTTLDFSIKISGWISVSVWRTEATTVTPAAPRAPVRLWTALLHSGNIFGFRTDSLSWVSITSVAAQIRELRLDSIASPVKCSVSGKTVSLSNGIFFVVQVDSKTEHSEVASWWTGCFLSSMAAVDSSKTTW